ncbi:hypothetical protein K3495_g3223 [Podosphaera aphanis]|nr:hypothetical protein K3495_g3223 [Podosphaera aphanis]
MAGYNNLHGFDTGLPPPGVVSYYWTTTPIVYPQPLVAQNTLPSTNFPNSSPSGADIICLKTCQINVLKCKEKPWKGRETDQLKFSKFTTPLIYTLGEFMGHLGHKPLENYILYEVAEMSGGRWSRGMSWAGSDKSAMAKQIKDVGWNETRKDRSQVWIWIGDKKK